MARSIQWMPIKKAMRSGPGAWKSGIGFVYAIFFSDGSIKVGASQNPAARFRESFMGHREDKARVALVFKGKNYLKPEMQFHRAMRRINQLRGDYATSEVYPAMGDSMRLAILRWLESGATISGLLEIKRAVQAFEADWRS